MATKINPAKPLKVIKANVNPLTIANQYLYHEFLKIFWDVADAPFRKKIKRSINRMYRRDGAHNYWLLVAAISEGWRLKWVFRLLTNPAYRWNLELRKISNLTMTGFNPAEVDKLIFKCRRNFSEFAEYYRNHPAFFKKYMPNLKPRPERDQHPVLAYWNLQEKQLRLFDGMRRATLAAINKKPYIKAYIGYPIKQGGPAVNLDKIQFLKFLFDGARRDAGTDRAFVKVARETVRQYQNGAQAFRQSLKPWSDARTKKFIKAVLKK
ncbi:MAG: hypothetical protein PHI73_00955 [Patescibacteria group bacterium]|nr:hypothetical protein [Patescibacteria group bacterium]